MKKTIAFALSGIALLLAAAGPARGEADYDMSNRFLKEGMRAEQREKYGRALNAYYHATLMDPDLAYAYQAIGRIYVKKTLYKNALEALKHALYLNKDDPETHYFLGVIYPIVEHNSAKAIEHYQIFLRLNSDPEKAAKVKKFIKKLQRMGDVKHDEGLVKMYNDGADLYNKGKYKEAEAAYKKAIDMNPHYAPAHEGLGLTYIKMKKFEAALKQFNEAIMIDPYTAESHYGLGIVYPIARDDVDRAIKHFKRYLELAPRSADAGKVKGFIAQLTQKKQARRAEAQLYNKGVDAFDSGNYAQAVSYYRQALKANSSYYEAYNGLGLALTQLKEYGDAIDAFENALDINPDYPDAHYGLGVVYPLVGEKTKAATHFWKYIGLKPDAPDMKQVLKWIEQLEG